MQIYGVENSTNINKSILFLKLFSLILDHQIFVWILSIQ